MVDTQDNAIFFFRFSFVPALVPHHVSHSGTLLWYQCNSRPENIIPVSRQSLRITSAVYFIMHYHHAI